MTISRTAYCEHCAQAGRPNRGDVYVVQGSQSTYVYKSKGGKAGFTPHFFELKLSDKGKVVVQCTCGMHGCGVEVYHDGEGYAYNEVRFSMRELSVNDWNALLLTPDLGYHQ